MLEIRGLVAPCARTVSITTPVAAPGGGGGGELTSRQLDQRELARFLQWEGHGRRGGGSEGCGGGGEEAAEHSQVRRMAVMCAGLSRVTEGDGI